MELKEFLEGIMMVQELYPDLLSRPSVEELELRYQHDLTLLNIKTQLLRDEQQLEREKQQFELMMKDKIFAELMKRVTDKIQYRNDESPDGQTEGKQNVK